MRITLPQELQEKVEREAQTADVSKQTKLVEIIDSYFRGDAPALTPTASHSELAPSLDLLKELIVERERYNQLYDQFQYLHGEYALIVTKLLPAAERTMTPWWTRLGRWLMGKD
jgi:uncharacterized secreted protein with C-terminal beta-propeller domain